MTDPDLEVTRIRRFGTIVARKRSDGSISAWLARYSSPVDGRRVQRSFESVRDAESWLAGEHELVEMHRRGLKQWVHPTDRDRRKKAGSMTFDELADWYVDTHRKPDGTALRGAARRNLRTDVGHLKDVFGGMTVKQITPDVISKWYFGEHAEGEWVFPSRGGFISSGSVGRKLREARGDEFEWVTSHVFRRTVATLISAERDAAAAAAQLGHANEVVTRRHYIQARTHAPDLSDVLELLANNESGLRCVSGACDPASDGERAGQDRLCRRMQRMGRVLPDP